MKLTPNEVINLLGVDAVLIPIKEASKAPKPRLGAWQKFTFKKTQADSYQKQLINAPAIGVVLQTDRTSLCSIDIDDDKLLEIFLAQNPKLKNTLRTKGKKGGNIWLKMKGDYPTSIKNLKHEAEPAGEWRVNSAYTIITGKHPEGMSYRVTIEKPVLEIEFSEINWKGFFPFSESCDTKDTNDIKNTNYTIEKKEEETKTTLPVSPIKRLMAEEQAREALKENKPLSNIYYEFILNRYTPQQGSRNTDLLSMTTFLFHVVAERLVIPLNKAYYEINQTVFIDPLETHLHEASEQLKNVKQTWLESLNTNERAFYDELNQIPNNDFTDSFRICRGLRGISDPEAKDDFFLSAQRLGQRLGLYGKGISSQGDRILKRLVGFGINSVVEKGTQHSKQGKGKATVYRWLL